MKIFHSSALRLLHLLLLAELFVHSSSRPAHSVSHCGVFRSMIPQIDKLMKLSQKLHSLTDDELMNFEGVEHKLDALPHMKHTAEELSSLKMNESLSLLYVYTQSFRLHVDWLKTAKENLSLSSQPAEDASSHLLHLSNLIKASLHQMDVEVPQPLPPASLPIVSSGFDALQLSVEISERLQTFCRLSKRVFLILRTQSRCPRH